MLKMRSAVKRILTTRLTVAEIAAALAMSETTVRRYRTIADAAKYTWADLAVLDDLALTRRFNTPPRGPTPRRPPDYLALHNELQTNNLASRQIMWEQYREQGPNALSYPQFCANLKAFKKRLPSSMRQRREPGKELFVDFSGKKPSYFDPITRQTVTAELFVSAMGCSNLMFAIATRTQQVPDVIAAHQKMLEYYGGCPEVLVPDNMKTAVIQSKPVVKLNRTYEDFANHHEMTVLPARPRHPKDKGAVENAVKCFQRWGLYLLNKEKFYSLDDLNRRIVELLEAINARVMKQYRASRRQRFEALDQPRLRPLAAMPYEYAEWKSTRKIPGDYHIGVNDHFYSVPHTLIGELAEARIAHDSVEIFVRGKCVAKHRASIRYGEHTTAAEHQPAHHRSFAERSRSDFQTWAQAGGPNTEKLVAEKFERKNPLLGLRECDGIKRLAGQYGLKNLEQAARRAFQMKDQNARSVTSLKSILRNVMGVRPTNEAPLAPTHRNIRGPAYYEGQRVH